MSRTKTFNFESLLLIKVPVTIGDKTYTLTEASTEIFAKYRGAIFARSTLKTNKGKAEPSFNLDGLAEMDIYLLSMCLTDDATGHNVLESEIGSWPTRITEPLIQHLKEISGMEQQSEGTEDDAKNSPSGTTDGSDSPTI